MHAVLKQVGFALVASVAFLAAQAAKGEVWPDLSEPPGAIGGGEQDVALIVGIEEYWQLPDIPGAVQNARDWFAFLTRTLGVKPSRATMLLNDDATLEEIRKVAGERAVEAHPDGIYWVIFIGHGTPGKEGDEGLLVGADAKASAASLYERSIAQSDLLAAVEGGEQARTMVILDTCFSGQTPAGEAIVPGLQPVLLSGSWEPDRSTVLTAAQGDQFAGPLPGVDRPAFSYLMLGALRGWGDLDGDGKVSAREALEYSRDTLAAVVRDRRQEPDGFGPGSKTTLSLAAEEGPDIAGIVLALTDGGREPAAEPGNARPAARLVPVAEEPSVEQKRQQWMDREMERREQARSGDSEAEVATTDPRVDELKERARGEWLATADLREAGGADGVAVVVEFLDRYEDAQVEVDGQPVPVEIELVGDARRWLEDTEARRRARNAVDDALDEEAEDLLQRAEIEWYALEPLRAQGGEVAVESVQAFIERYRRASVEVGGTTRDVAVPLVELARGWLEIEVQRAAAAAAAVEPSGPVIRYALASADPPASRDEYLADYGYTMEQAHAGSFLMGSPGGEEGRGDGESQHRVELTHAFAIGATEVPQRLWEAVMGSNPPAERERYWAGQPRGTCAEYKGESLVGDDLPVHCVDWYDAIEFCNRLSELEGLRPAYAIDGKDVVWDMNASGYRLPTEAEWEFAARADDDYVYSGSDYPDSVAWYRPTAEQRTRPVGSRQANRDGLYDMSGNVAEWTWDWYGDHGTARQSDPTGPESGTERTRKGGSFNSDAAGVRVAARSRVGPAHRGVGLGFRIARNAK